MHKEVEKEYERLKRDFGLEVTEEIIKASVNQALAGLIKQGMPKQMVERMIRSAKPLGDFAWFQARLPFEEFNNFFGGPVREWGIDGSRTKKAFGASTAPEIENISPYRCSVDTYEKMMGKPEKKDPAKEDIFYAGHMIEPVYRDFFRRMYAERYIVFDCDIQWASRKYEHFVGNVDGLLYDKETGQFGILEIKHTTANNVRTQKAVQNGEPPKYWDMQERCYLELLDLDFACLFLGWGNRPGLDTNAMHRIERDKSLGEGVLNDCEDFMVYNVEAHKKPSYKNVKIPERVKQSIEEIYGPVDPSKKEINFKKDLQPVLEQLEIKQKEIAKLKEVKKEAEKKVEDAEAEFEALSLPLIEELKNAPKGTYKDQEGTRYYVTYDVPNALDIESIKTFFPNVYDEFNKLAVDTTALKKKYPDVYKDCYGPKKDGKRKFTFKAYKEK